MAKIAMTLAVPDLTGASRMLFYFARSLVRRGHEVVVAHGTAPIDKSGSPASIIPELQSEGIETKHSRLLRRPVPPFVYSEVVKLIGRSEAVIGFNQRDRSVALKVARRLDVPGILAVQNQHNFWGPPGIRQLKKHYYARTIRECATQLVCTSPKTLEEVVAFGAEPHRCTVLINGIELPPAVTEKQKQKARQTLGICDSARVFVNVGRLDTQKGQDLLIRAWANQRARKESDQLCLIGDTTEGNQASRSNAFKRQLQSLVSELGVDDSVNFMGWRNDVGDVLSAADGYIHSARWEGYPLAVMEGMAAGLPVVITDCSGEPEGFIVGTHGYVANKDSAESLTTGISALLEKTDDENTKMGHACRTFSEEQFDINVTGNKFVDIVEDELKKWNLK